MFSRFTKAGHPSAVLLLGEPPGRLSVLHVVPENGEAERLDTTSTKRCFGKGTERAREHIGTVTLDNAGGSDTTSAFMDDLLARVQQLSDGASGSSAGDATRVVEGILRPAATEALRARGGRASSANASSYPLYLVHIDRPAPGAIITNQKLGSIG